MPEPRILIVGAGPTGIGAAWRLNELGHTNWELFEASDRAGGLASSVIDPHGFTWDLGGHVLFSHYRYFDNLMATALGEAWVEHVREAWVWMRERWIPYPFQNNIWRLPADELQKCLDGLVELERSGASRPPASFRDWLLASFGSGLCETFMFPYNRKVWAYDPAALDVGWMGERVARPDLARIRRNIAEKKDDVGWGPNSTFRFPLHGGTGAIWRSLAGKLPQDRLHFGRAVTGVDLDGRSLMVDHQSHSYDYLISTIPLDLLLRSVRGRPALSAAADRFVHSSSHIIGIGLAGGPPQDLQTKCWIYFPEDRTPFYRATVFSNYSPNNAPPGHWSVMGEVSESPGKPVDADRVVDETIAGFVDSGMIDPARIVSRWHRRLEHGYPTPWLGRDEVLAPVEAELRAAGIFSRGRFGAWKYEVSNQDHSVMQGVEAVNHIVAGVAERTYFGDMSDD